MPRHPLINQFIKETLADKRKPADNIEGEIQDAIDQLAEVLAEIEDANDRGDLP